MSKRDTMIRALCKSLGVDYRVTTIDLERVIYRDFGNGFNVEISGMHTSSMKKKATIYLWYGDTMTECIIVKTVRDIPRELIGESVEELMKYSNLLIAQGYDSYDKLFRLKYGKTINYAGGVKNMTHRIFYGTDFKLTDSDKKMFQERAMNARIYCREGQDCLWWYLRNRTRIFQYGKCSMDFRVWCSLLMKMQWISAETDLQD